MKPVALQLAWNKLTQMTVDLTITPPSIKQTARRLATPLQVLSGDVISTQGTVEMHRKHI